jgi:transcription-repair coupling factor (superfamily II helicase)
LAAAAGKPIVVLTAEPLESQRLAEEIPIFSSKLRVRPLPDWETLPYDSFSPHQDLISERLRTLHALMLGEV